MKKKKKNSLLFQYFPRIWTVFLEKSLRWMNWTCLKFDQQIISNFAAQATQLCVDTFVRSLNVICVPMSRERPETYFRGVRWFVGCMKPIMLIGGMLGSRGSWNLSPSEAHYSYPMIIRRESSEAISLMLDVFILLLSSLFFIFLSHYGPIWQIVGALNNFNKM